jgi:hypothetical protein
MMVIVILLSTFAILAPKTCVALCVPSQGNLMVTVVDAATSNPIVGANVSIQGPEACWNTTGTNGNWVFYNIGVGKYKVTATMVGYLPNSTWVCVCNGQTSCCILSLQVVSVPSQGNLMVTVVDAATSNPIVGANVSIVGPETGWNTTGSNGNWTFYNVQAGSYTVTASMAGYLSNSTSAVVYQGQTTHCILSLQVTTLLPDVAVIEVVPDADWVYQGKLCHAGVNVTVANLGGATENFTVSLYAFNANAIPANVTIGTEQVTNLLPNENLVLRFVWNSQGAQPSYWYNITAVASTVPGEVNVANNVKSSVMLVKVRLFGDANDDGSINILDAITAAMACGSSPGDSRWNLAADLNNDGAVDILDMIVMAGIFSGSFDP